MKKIILGVFVLTMAVSLTGCSKPGFLQKKAEEVVKDTQTVVEETTDNATAQSEDRQGMFDDNLKKENTASKDEAKAEPVFKPQQTLLILDASGSMWGKIDGKAKIDIAKEVTKKTVAQFKDTELGLMAYGHRRKGDCTDIEILTVPAKNNADNISKMVDSISPKGMTPMGNSVLQAAESLKYTEQKATVILISDGIETCDVDLCALGKKLEATGIDFTAHVIGFDMTQEQTAGLKCLASETGGTFTLAKNADDLDKALKDTVEASSCSKEKIGEITLIVPKTVGAGSSFDIQYTGLEPKSEDFVAIVPTGSSERNDHLSYFYPTKDESTLTTPVEVGSYDVVYFAGCGAVLGRVSLNVTEVTASIVAPKTVAVGSKFKITYTGPKNDTDFIALVPKNSTDPNRHLSYIYPSRGEYDLTAPVEKGEYDIVYFANRKKILTKVNITVTEATASISGVPTSVVKGNQFTISWTGPDNDNNAITILPRGSQDWNAHVGGNLYHLDGTQKSGTLTAPKEPGEYDVTYWLGTKKILDRKAIIVTN